MYAITFDLDSRLLKQLCPNASECVALVQDVAETYDWFTPSLKHTRTQRIEENSDLMPIPDRKQRRKRQ